MNSRTVKEGVRELSQYIPFKLPATGWYYSKEKPRGSIDVVNLWVDALSLTGLVALANFDSKTNDSVVVHTPQVAKASGQFRTKRHFRNHQKQSLVPWTQS